MGRRAKSGHRTKSERLSRAYQGPARDPGTPELLVKRLALVNGAPPELSATASGILFARGYISRDQCSAADRYRRLHAAIFGRPWRQACPLGEPAGRRLDDEEI
jgi:hypothetical protein